MCLSVTDPVGTFTAFGMLKVQFSDHGFPWYMPRKSLLIPVGHAISSRFSSSAGQVPGALCEAVVQTITSMEWCVVCDD